MRLFLTLVLACAASWAFAERELTAITLHYASPQQLLPVIRPYLSEGSSVSAYQNQLVLNATPQELAKTRELLQRLDQAGRQLQISVRTDNSGSDDRRSVDVDSVIRAGDTVILTGPGRPGPESRTSVRVENYSAGTTGQGNQGIRVTEGRPAYIATGVSAPVQSYTVGADGRRHIQQDYLGAVAGFYATTWLNDGVVRVQIEQGNDRFDGGTIAAQQLQSEVTGALGKWLPIGTIDTSSRQQHSGIGSRTETSRASSTQLFIKVETLD